MTTHKHMVENNSIVYDNKVIFYKPSSPFSTWHNSSFRLDNKHFNCVEQYLNYEKARYYKRFDVAGKVLQEKDPKEQKALGRSIKTDSVSWKRVCEWIMYDANFAKFTQNRNLNDLILEYKNYEFIYATENDKIWGTGVNCEDENGNFKEEFIHKENWYGLNLLGNILKSVVYEISKSDIVDTNNSITI